MKLYLAHYWSTLPKGYDQDEGHIGVFSSAEKAEAACKEFERLNSMLDANFYHLHLDEVIA